MDSLLSISIDLENKKDIIITENLTKYKIYNKSTKTFYHFIICSKNDEFIGDICEGSSLLSPIYVMRNKNKEVIAALQREYDIRGIYFNITYNGGKCYIKNTIDENIIHIYKKETLLGTITKTRKGSSLSYSLTINIISSIPFTAGLFILYIISTFDDSDVLDEFPL